jgi:hypothetical protein
MDSALRSGELTLPVRRVEACSPATRVPGADLAAGLQHHPSGNEFRSLDVGGEGLVERHPHPTHGRILQVTLTDDGRL